MASEKADIGLIGLAVMGQNLILNMNDHGFKVCVFNRTVSKVDEFLNKEAKGTNVIGAHSLEDLVEKLRSPRKIMLMVMAGKPVDEFIDKLVPLLSPGDIIIDGGNSEYTDTNRRCKMLQEKHNLLYVGCGVSGGEEGARYGPSLMPGGNPVAWPHVKQIFQSIAAKVKNESGADEACCEWVGNDGAGHFVKMVHNGIEYGDMQLICEAYHLMLNLLKISYDDMAKAFREWNDAELASFLIEITADIMSYRDPQDGSVLVDKIRDTAGQKGTGKWTAINALDFGVPVTLIAESVFARCLSSMKEERIHANKMLPGPSDCREYSAAEKTKFLKDIEQGLYASKIVSYAQGFMLMREASNHFKWDLNFGNIALMWRGGCIIRSKFLGNIKAAYTLNPKLNNLLLDSFFTKALIQSQAAWRRVVSEATLHGVPIPAFSTALAFYDGYRCERLPANLLQAQRDYFGAHTYELLTNPGKFVHTNWTGRGGTTSSTSYQV